MTLTASGRGGEKTNEGPRGKKKNTMVEKKENLEVYAKVFTSCMFPHFNTLEKNTKI